MPGTPTAYHAYNLFCLTMESRFGATWRSDVAEETVAGLAEEIARGFGGASTPAAGGIRNAATIWRFPDRSQVATGPFGLRRHQDPGEQAA